jgi:signal transduction histidine kinase
MMLMHYLIQSRAGRYALGVVASVAPVLVALPFAESLPLPDPLFVGAIVLTAWLAGLGPAVLATVGSVLILDYFFVDPLHTLALHDLPWVLMFTIVSLILAKLAADHRRITGEREQLLRDEQRARREAEAANAALNQFLAMISHELRTPLTVILSWVGIVRTGGADAVPRGLEVIERNARTQARLIDDLLDASRAVTGKLRLDVQRVSVPAVVDVALESIVDIVTRKGLRVTKTISAAPDVPADPARLQQVVTNLLVNAVKFTPEGGVIDVRVDREQAWVRVVVRDTGIGIEPEMLPRIFDRFVQGEVLRESHDGLGLGLSIVRHIMELHRGTVHAESEGRGKGATFVVRLPIAPLESASQGDGRRTPRHAGVVY